MPQDINSLQEIRANANAILAEHGLGALNITGLRPALTDPSRAVLRVELDISELRQGGEQRILNPDLVEQLTQAADDGGLCGRTMDRTMMERFSIATGQVADRLAESGHDYRAQGMRNISDTMNHVHSMTITCKP